MKNKLYVFLLLIITSLFACKSKNEKISKSCFITGDIPNITFIDSDSIRLSASQGIMEENFSIWINSNDITNNIGETDFLRVFIDVDQNKVLDSNDLVFESSNGLHAEACQIVYNANELQNICLNDEVELEMFGTFASSSEPFNEDHVIWFFKTPMNGIIKSCEIHFKVQIISNSIVKTYPESLESLSFKNVFVFDTSE